MNVITPGTEVTIDAMPYAPEEDWRAVISKDEATKKVKITSLTPKCVSTCFMPRVQTDVNNSFSWVDDTTVHYDNSCGSKCATWWNGNKLNLDGSLYSPITIQVKPSTFRMCRLLEHGSSTTGKIAVSIQQASSTATGAMRFSPLPRLVYPKSLSDNSSELNSRAHPAISGLSNTHEKQRCASRKDTTTKSAAVNYHQIPRNL